MKRFAAYYSAYPEMSKEGLIGYYDTTEEAIKAIQEAFEKGEASYYGIYDNETEDFIEFELD